MHAQVAMPDYDVAVVGGSIAACSTATLLGRQGGGVALVESHSDPSAFKRMCAQASASPTIERHGLTQKTAPQVAA